jgi:hypothetical protein
MTLGTLCVTTAACKKDKDPATGENAKLAFTSFVPTIEKIMEAGIAAKDLPGGAAVDPPIQIVGAVTGTGGVGGMIANSTGNNTTMNLWVELHDYADTNDVSFNTDNTSDDTKLQFDLSIQNQPQDNTMNGTIDGVLSLDGEVEGTGTFDLAFDTDLDDDNTNPFLICSRVTGTVVTATNTTSLDFMIVHLTSALDATQQANCDAL